MSVGISPAPSLNSFIFNSIVIDAFSQEVTQIMTLTIPCGSTGLPSQGSQNEESVNSTGKRLKLDKDYLERERQDDSKKPDVRSCPDFS